MKQGATFSLDRVYRYRLFRMWDSTKPFVLFVGLNPSIANVHINDPTVTRCIGFSKSWGFGGLFMGNLFALVSTDPRGLRNCPDPVGLHTNMYLKKMEKQAKLTICAWGIHGHYLDRHSRVLSFLKNPHCLGVTKDNFPRHPLWTKKDLVPIPYEV